MCILHQHSYQILFRYIHRRFGFLGKLELHFCWTFFSYVAKNSSQQVFIWIEIIVAIGLFVCLPCKWRNDKHTFYHSTDLILVGHHAYWETNIHSTVSSRGIWWTHRYRGKYALSPRPARTISFNSRALSPRRARTMSFNSGALVCKARAVGHHEEENVVNYPSNKIWQSRDCTPIACPPNHQSAPQVYHCKI